MSFLTDPARLGATLFINDRNAFDWEWQGHRLIGAIHVDGVLFAVSSHEIRDEFMRRLKAEFRVTGGDEEATGFCGLGFSGTGRHTGTLKQEAFARTMMDKHGMWVPRHKPTPLKVSGSKLELFEGEVADEETVDYSMVMGTSRGPRGRIRGSPSRCTTCRDSCNGPVRLLSRRHTMSLDISTAISLRG